MKKMYAAVAVLMLLLFLFTGCGNAKLQKAYDALGSIAFSDESVLTDGERTKLNDIRERREQYLENKDVDGLLELQEEWESFRGPIDSLIEEYEAAKDTFFDSAAKDMLTDEERSSCQSLEKNIGDAFMERDEQKLASAINEWNAFSGDLREIIDTYNSLEKPQFSEKDMSLLSDETRAEMQTLQEKTEAAFASRDAAGMKSLKGEWYAYAEKASAEIEAAKDKILNDWVSTASFTSSAVSLFSFGTIAYNTSIEGHTIIYTTQYKYEVESNEQIEQAMEQYLSFVSGAYQAGVKDLQTYIDDAAIRVEYKDMNGNVICSKEFS